MPVRLFKLRDVPEDEAADVRQLLDEHGIVFYETGAGALGLGTPAIWLRDDSRLLQARQLIDAYQLERAERIRAGMATEPVPTMLDRLRANPLQFLLFVAMILFMLYVSLAPFLDFGK